MKPYYEQDGITIYHGDCREMLTDFSVRSELLCTDPPYPGLAGNVRHKAFGVARRRQESRTVGQPWVCPLEDWLPLAAQVVRRGMLVFCSFHSVDSVPRLALPLKRVALLTWYKRNAPVPVQNVPRFTTEYIWCLQGSGERLDWRSLSSTMFDIANINPGCVSTGERITEVDGSASHPTQKPLNLMLRLLTVGGATVLDPFMGTGTTLVAAKNLGRRAIGIEIEERYCEIAAERLSQGVLALGDQR